MQVIRRAITLAITIAASTAFSGQLSDASRAEITALLGRLRSSSCEFYRNGTWYDAREAEAHLRKKYDYLAKKGQLATTEDFIAKAASQSSMSGEAYQVRCPNTPAQASADWLTGGLKEIRATPAP